MRRRWIAAVGAAAVAVATVPATAALAEDPGGLYGYVYDDQDFHGLDGICVTAWSAGDPIDGTETVSGYYELALAPGDYKVYFQDCDGVAPDYDDEWYDDADDFGSASPVTVVSNRYSFAEAYLTDSHPVVSGHIYGNVYDRSDYSYVEGICVHAWDESPSLVGSTTSDQWGYYELALPTGTYKVHYEDCDGVDPRYDEQWYFWAADIDSADPVTVWEGDWSWTAGYLDRHVAEPDLAVTSLSDTTSGLNQHTTTVELANLGDLGGRGNLVVEACPTSGGSCDLIFQELFDLAVGASAVRHLTWATTLAVGDLQIHAAVYTCNADSDPTNNERTTASHALTGGPGVAVGLYGARAQCEPGGGPY